MVNRETACPVEVGGVTVPAGVSVVCATGSANHDETRYDNAEVWDLDRPPVAHLAFGTGRHQCLGMHLARLELRVGLTAILDRLPGLRLDPPPHPPPDRGHGLPLAAAPRRPLRHLTPTRRVWGGPTDRGPFMTPKITIVGGGSTHWTPRLLADFANTASLRDCSVALTDIDESSLPPMLTIAKHIVTSRRIGMDVTATTDLAAALDGADFVIIALSVGGFASMAHDLEIPARYGIWQPVGDSVGPGGIARSLRSIPVVVRIAAEVERCAPDATLLNVSNPLTALCRAVSSQTSVRTVGLCNELVGLQFWLSLVFDADMREIDPVVAGVNHLPARHVAAHRR